MADDKLEYQITAKDGVTPVLKKVNKSFGDTDKGAQKMGAGMVAVGTLMADAAKAAMTQIIALGKATLQEADDFKKFGSTVNMSAAEVAGLDRVYTLAGGSTDGLKSAMLSLSAALDPTKITKQRTAVEALGVSVTNSDGTMKDHKQLLMDISDAYNKETSAVKKAAIGKRIFGSESQKINEMLSMGSAELQKQSSLYADASGYTQDLAGNYESFNDAITKVEISIKGALAALTDSTLFNSAVSYISKLSDEWVQFLADLKTKEANEAAKKNIDTINEMQKAYEKAFNRKAKGLSYNKELSDASELAIEATKNGTKQSDMYMAQELAMGSLIKAMKDQGVSAQTVAYYQQQLTEIGTRRKSAIADEAKAAEDAAKKEKDAKKGVLDETEKINKAEKGEKREFKFVSKRDQLLEEQRIRDANEKAMNDSRDAEREYQKEMADIRKSTMSDEMRQRTEAREWYEEKKKIVGDDADLRLAYELKIKDIERQKNEETLAAIEQQQQAEMARFQVQQDLAAATFTFLHTATDGYKSLGAVAKAVALAEAWWNTYVAFTKALSEYGPVMGPVFGAIALAQGAAMTAKIQAQKFASGGIVSGSEYGDRNQIFVNGGEMVLNKQQQSRMFNLLAGKNSEVSKLRGRSQSSNININVNGMMMDNRTIRKIQSAMVDVNRRS